MSARHEADQQALIERIVGEVLDRLRTNKTATTNETSNQKPEQNPASDRLELADRVVTTATLEGRLAGRRAIVVLPQAVVTPAARDLLREQNIAIERRARGERQAELGLRRVVGVAETSFEPAAMLAGVSAIEFEQVARVGLVGVIDDVVDQVVRGGALGLVFTDQADAALCLANRTAGVRAVLARSAAQVRQARSNLAANLFVVEPRSKSLFELRQIVMATTSSSGHSLDETCRQRLS